MLRQRAMQAFGNPQLELTGVVLEIVRLPDRQAVLQSRLQPCSLGISRIGNRCPYGRARYSFNVFMILLAFYDLSDHFYIDSLIGSCFLAL